MADLSHDVEIEDGEIIDGHGQELVAAGHAPVTLFKTDDPIEIINKATHVADALSDVLKKKNLTTRIGNKDHVNVEGWTLCGTMLGIFPVVEWTRQVDNGWEARVEARTLSGAVVGAAEAECLRSEKRWSSADDYSVRSMAQTRAISKALRAPLGFIVALAGYETTPEEEMPERTQTQRPFDVEKDLLPGAPSGTSEIVGLLTGVDNTVDWQEVLSSLTLEVWGVKSWRELGETERKDFWRRLANTAKRLSDQFAPGAFPPPSDASIKAALAWAFQGTVVEIAYNVPDDEEPAPIPSTTPILDDDVPFGDG